MKVDLKIPKGTKCKGGICEKDIEIEGLEIPEINPTITRQVQPEVIVQGQQSQIMQPPITQTPHITTTPPIKEEKELTHKEMSELIPKGINAMSCPGGKCGHEVLKNPKKTRKYKTCPNGECEANTIVKDSEFCPYCEHKIKHPEDLEDGIELPNEEDDE